MLPDYTVGVNSIVSFIDSGKAKFCAVVECDSTKTRNAFVSEEFRHPIMLPVNLHRSRKDSPAFSRYRSHQRLLFG